MSDSTPSAAFTNLTDLAAKNLGGRALLCSDDFFASMHNLLEPQPAVFDAARYTERGKWMDGWESRRKRVPGHDWCIVALGAVGTIRGLDIDTHHFLGNHAPFASVQGCFVAGEVTPEQLRDEIEWTEILPQAGLLAGSHNLFATTHAGVLSHVRLNIFPDGGVARLRVYGAALAAERGDSRSSMNLAAVTNGGQAIACSDMFFSPMVNLISPGVAEHMGGGWETRRRRSGGHDWIIVRLAQPGTLDHVHIDTRFFKGNFPHHCAVDGIHWRSAPPTTLIESSDWQEIVPSTRLEADAQCNLPVSAGGPFTHVRLRIYPCGGVSRLKISGTPAPGPVADPLIGKLNGMSKKQAASALARCCGARRWVARMTASRPFWSYAELLGVAETTWWDLGDGDWLEAFGHHPKIGTDVDSLREKFAATAELAASEQAGIAGASAEALEALAEKNRAYDEKFGYIFIVCASGRSADEMLAIVTDRLDNSAEDELRIAAGEQAKITRLRLAKLEES